MIKCEQKRVASREMIIRVYAVSLVLTRLQTRCAWNRTFGWEFHILKSQITKMVLRATFHFQPGSFLFFFFVFLKFNSGESGICWDFVGNWCKWTERITGLLSFCCKWKSFAQSRAGKRCGKRGLKSYVSGHFQVSERGGILKWDIEQSCKPNEKQVHVRQDCWKVWKLLRLCYSFV